MPRDLFFPTVTVGRSGGCLSSIIREIFRRFPVRKLITNNPYNSGRRADPSPVGNSQLLQRYLFFTFDPDHFQDTSMKKDKEAFHCCLLIYNFERTSINILFNTIGCSQPMSNNTVQFRFQIQDREKRNQITRCNPKQDSIVTFFLLLLLLLF